MAKTNVNPTGNLDLENDLLYVKNGDYVDALDITTISDGNGNTLSVEPVIGNTFLYQLGSQQVQDKQIKIQMEVGSSSYDLDFRRPNNSSITTVNVLQNASASVMIAQAVIDIQAALVSAYPLAVVTGNVAGVYVIVSGLDIYGWEWFINNTGSLLATFETVQEGFDAGAAGEFKEISNYDLNGDYFAWSSTRANLVETKTIVSVAEDNSHALGTVMLEIPNHGLKDGEVIQIAGVFNNGVSMDGEWIAQHVVSLGEIDANRIYLFETTFTGPYTLVNATASVNLYSASQIGVVTEDVNNPVVALQRVYTPLVTTKALGFRTKKRIHPFVEADVNKLSFYFTDGYNDIRSMYYFGAYALNGFLNTTNGYTYDTINEASKLIIDDVNLKINFSGVIQTGGAVVSGNHRFAACLVTTDGTESVYSELSGAVNVYSTVSTLGTNDVKLKGDTDGTITGKSIKLQITGLNPVIYKYIKVIDVIDYGVSASAFEIGKYVINDTTFNLTFTGHETLAQFDIGLLNRESANYRTAESLDVLDRRMILSNVTGDAIHDFSDFFATFKHSIEYKTVPSIGDNNVLNTTTWDFIRYRQEEYFKPDNVFSNMSYMVNETYRVMGRVRMKSGYVIPPAFHIDDICIDNNSVNTGNVTVGYVNRRVAGSFTDYSLDEVTEDMRLPYFKLSGFDLNFIVDGVRVKDLISEILIDIVPMEDKYKEVLASGFSISCVQGQGTFVVIPPGPNSTLSALEMGTNLSPGAVLTDRVIEYWNMFQIRQSTQAPGYTSHPAGITEKRKIVSFYSPDCYLGGKQITYRPGDQVNCFSDPGVFSTTDTTAGSAALNATDSLFNNIYAEMRLRDQFGAFATYNLDDCQFCPIGGNTANLGGTGQFMTKRLRAAVTTTAFNSSQVSWKYADSYALSSASDIVPYNGYNYGIFYTQYFRPNGKGAKFGNVQDNITTYTGSFLTINSSTPPTGNVISVFGGDVFTQHTYLKFLMPESTATFAVLQPPNFNGFGHGIRITTQNRINAQMRYADPATLIVPPELNCNSWLVSQDPDQIRYTHTYDDNNGTLTNAVYNVNSRPESNKFITRIPYSDVKPNNSIMDNYRRYQPLNFRDLDQNAGPIIHHMIINGELVTLQPRGFERQYFNSTGMLVSSGGSEVILGDGAALSRRGQKLSSIGTKHKWSVIKGVSKGGADVAAWINTEYGYIMRFGYDGTNPISHVHNISGFLDKNTKWVDTRIGTSEDESAHGVWNQERNEYIWAIRARKSNQGLFDSLKVYSQGDIVYAFNGISQFPDIYQASGPSSNTIGFTSKQVPVTFIQNGFFVSDFITSPVDVSDTNYWVKLTDASLRNEYSLVYNERKDGFSTKLTPVPRIYGKWKKKYTSPSPFNPQLGFIHNEGEIADWYSFVGDHPMRSTPYITMIMNQAPDTKKNFQAIELNNDVTPAAINYATGAKMVEFETEQHQSFLTPTEFEQSEEADLAYTSAIKNDSKITGVNDADSSTLFGRYLKVKFNFSRLVFDKLFGVVIKNNFRARNNRT